MRGPRARLGLAVAVGVATSCGGTHHAATPPVTFAVGAFTVTVAPDTANLSVAGPGGVSLLDGLDASDDVGTPQSQNDDAPPMTGFAVRDVATTYDMQYGSFAVTDDTSQPWQVVRRAAVSGTGVDLFDGHGGRLASLAVSQGDDADHLVVAITAGDGAPPASSDPAAPRRRISWGFGCTADDHFAGFGAQTWGVDA
ncbi:MAG: hypothetical protein ACRELB_09345, partial [Polyangiaceae bacterium]